MSAKPLDARREFFGAGFPDLLIQSVENPMAEHHFFGVKTAVRQYVDKALDGQPMKSNQRVDTVTQEEEKGR